MLTKTAIEQGLRFNQTLADNNLFLEPKTGSMLSELVNASIPPVYNNESLSDDIGLHTSAAEYSPHSDVVNSYVDLLVPSIQAHIKTAKDVVLPIVKELTDNVVTAINMSDDLDTVSGVEIVMYKKPELASNYAILDMVEVFKGTTHNAPAPVTLGSKTVDEVLMLSTIGSKSIDDDILAYLSSVNKYVLEDAYTCFFNYKDFGTSVEEYLDPLTGYELFTVALVGYLCARRLYDVVPADLDMSLTEYRNKVASLRDYLGHKLLSSVERMDSYDKSDTLIVKLDTRTKVIKVNDRLYKEWLKENTEDAILGTIASSRPRFIVSLLLQDKERLTNEWNSYKTYTNLHNARKKIKNIKELVCIAVYNHLSGSGSDIEKSYMGDNPSHFEQVNKNLDSYINSLTDSQLEDIPSLMLHAVAKCRFYFTSAYTILSAMEEAAKHNSELNPREAALVSVISYVTDYLVDQVKVVSRDGSVLPN